MFYSQKVLKKVKLKKAEMFNLTQIKIQYFKFDLDPRKFSNGCISETTSSKSSKMRYLKAVKLQHTKWKKLALWKNSVRKMQNGKSRNWAIFEKLALNHIHIDSLFPLFIFLYSSTLWYDIASPYHRSDLRLDLTTQMTHLISK